MIARHPRPPSGAAKRVVGAERFPFRHLTALELAFDGTTLVVSVLPRFEVHAGRRGKEGSRENGTDAVS